MAVSPPLRVGLLNMWCFGGPVRRARQEAILAAAGFDVLCLLEVNPKDIERFAEASGSRGGGVASLRMPLGDL